MTDCQGEWRGERILGESGVRVMTCSECREIWAFFGTQSYGTFPRGTSDMTIIHAVLQQKGGE